MRSNRLSNIAYVQYTTQSFDHSTGSTNDQQIRRFKFRYQLNAASNCENSWSDYESYVCEG